MSPRPSDISDRLTLLHAGEADGSFVKDVRAGLSAAPKRLSCRYFYDAAGSELFEDICRLPEYYPTRAERDILQTHAPEIVACLPAGAALAELGSGSADKTRLLLEALLRERSRLRYVPIDISATALEASAAALLGRYPRLEVAGIVGEYAAALARLDEVCPRPRALLWLGSNIGNFARPAAARFVASLAAGLSGADRLLLGVDLRKDERVLRRAYDDAAGVTARFNKNILERANRELGADFDLSAFAHQALYHRVEGRVEMRLLSRRRQTVRLPALDMEVEFEAGEALHTEDSFKYSEREVKGLAAGAGCAVERCWRDRGRRFGLYLLAPTASGGVL